MSGQHGASLTEQMAALQKRVGSREARRAREREERVVGGDYDGARATYNDDVHRPPPAKRRAPNATGGVPLSGGSAAAAVARVAAAAQLAGPTLRRCDLCSATFGSEREMAQHLEGAAHRKAVERQAAEAERRRRLGAYADMAASAVQQAAWQGGPGPGQRAQQPGVALHSAASAASASGGNSAPLGGGGRGGGRGSSQQQAAAQQQAHVGGRGVRRATEAAAAAAAAAAAHARSVTSHEDMLRQARSEDKAPLDIGGWVPPTLPQPAPPSPAQQAQQAHVQAIPQAADEQQSGQGAADAGDAGVPLLGGLVSYSEDEEEIGGAGTNPDATGTAGNAAQQGLQHQDGEQHPARVPDASDDSDDDDGSSSESLGGEGGCAPASFFTF